MLKICSLVLLAGVLPAQQDAAEQVRRAETAFAKTMADRDLSAFTAFIASDGMFVNPKGVLRGPQGVAAGWKRFFEGTQAPFSWEPDQVHVLESGSLALSSGPVRDPNGKRIGTFNSIWRREPDGKWKVLIDHGCPPCECK